MINKNQQLILDISEKQASKYLLISGNSFATMIENKLIVANNNLQIEKLENNIP
jgi:hypothetical protein